MRLWKSTGDRDDPEPTAYCHTYRAGNLTVRGPLVTRDREKDASLLRKRSSGYFPRPTDYDHAS
jgi:hypothetical protein